MSANVVYRRFLKIVGIFMLVTFFSLTISESASAQAIVSGSFNPVTKVLTAVDSVGDVYTANLSTFSPTSKSAIPGTFTTPGGQPLPVTLTVIPLGGGQFTVISETPTHLLLACSVNSVALSASCQLSNSPRSLGASIKGELHSQVDTVIDMITDRLQTLSRDLAEGSAASTETPPGGTVILNNFSSNPQPKYNGLSAGSDPARWGLWASASGSYLQNTGSANSFTGPSVVALTGLDYIVDRQWIFGLAAGYTHADLALSPSSINREVDGAVVGPYAAYIVNPNWAVDALVNWTSLSNNITAPLPFPAGSYHSNRITAASNLNYFTSYNGFKLTGFGGYAYSWEGGNPNAILPSALANNVRYGAIRIGGEAAYPVGAFEPYLPLKVEYETTTPNDGTSRAALIVGAGLRYRWSDSLTGGLLFETTELKTHTRDMLVSGHLRWSF